MQRWCWGLDVAQARLGVGLVEVESGGFQSHAIEFREGKGSLPLSEELERGWDRTLQWAKAVRFTHPPATIALEVPRGRFPHPELLMMTGAVCLAMIHATSLRPWEINVSTWKRQFREDGIDLAKKSMLVPWLSELGWIVPRYRDHNGRNKLDEDRAAGVAIAGAARRIFFERPTTDLHPVRPVITVDLDDAA